MKTIYHWVLITIAVIVILFVMQNMGRTEVSILFWVLNPHLSVIILMTFGFGFAADWIVRFLRRRAARASIRRAASVKKTDTV